MREMSKQGIYEKYRVERTDGKPIEWCFVLEIGDPAARVAMIYYACMVKGGERDKLAQDLFAVLDTYCAEHGIEGIL